ncbi:MAG: OmpA family protein [Bacteroidota bacterium]
MKKFTRHGFQLTAFVLAKRFLSKLLLFFPFLLMPVLLLSQEKTIEKANLAYKYKQYAQAASLYETVIAEKEEGKSKSPGTLNLKTKLAYCYRMNNKMDQAEKLYAEIVADERAKAKTYLYYGETLMCNGKYEEAKKWFRDYQVLEPNDKQAALLAANCDKIKYIEPYFPYVDIQPFAHNSDADDNAPVAWQNGIVFSSDRKQGAKLLKEKSGWTGRDYLDLYFSVLQEDEQYGEPRRFSAKLSEVNKNTGNASFSSDGTEVFFTRNDNVLNKKDTYMLQLFSSQDNGNGKWKKAEKLPFCSPNFSFMHPAISPDGKELFFATNRKGEGGVDLWVSKRKDDGWGKPENLGPTINTSANEGFPFVDENGRLYFCSKGHPGYGGFDIFFTERDDNGNWKTPQNLGQPINSPLDDISIYINVNNQSGMFTSSRGGGDDDIFFFEIMEHPKEEEPIADIIPVANEKQEKYVNKKPTTIHGAESQEELSPTEKMPPAPVTEEATIVSKNENTTKVAEEETPPKSDPAVPAVPSSYQPTTTTPAETTEEPASEQKEQTETEVPVSSLPFELEEKKAAPSEEAAPLQPEQIESENPAASLPLEPGKEEPAEEKAIEKSADIFFEMPTETEPVETETTKPASTPPAVHSLFAFQEFMDGARNNEILTGKIYRLDGAIFDPYVWQLTPRISKKLNDLVAVLRRFPTMQIEISAHTESLGPETQNLDISKNRARMAVEYIIKEGISPDRIKGDGYGEAHLLNHCKDGVTCSMEEHLYNQRLEVRVIKGIGH